MLSIHRMQSFLVEGICDGAEGDVRRSPQTPPWRSQSLDRSAETAGFKSAWNTECEDQERTSGASDNEHQATGST